MTSLQELTGQESGVVIYGNEAVICNWSSFDGLPKVGPWGGLIDWPNDMDEDSLMVCQEEELSDGEAVSQELEGVEIIYDENGDAKLLLSGNQAGTIYTIDDDETIVIVIAPDGWN